MPELPMRISCGKLLLQALYAEGSSPDGDAAVLCHPHPLYGGSMENNVVCTLRDSLGKWGWATLRFNFRGVGASDGEYAEGDGAAEDVLAAVSFLKQRGIDRVHVAGYSFGAWAALHAVARGLCPTSIILASPPLNFLDFRGLQLPKAPCFITLGDRDSFSALESLQKWLEEQRSCTDLTFCELPGCDHFYWNHERMLADRLTDFLRSHFSPRA